MSNISYGGTLPMKVDEPKLIGNDAMMGLREYPFYIPDVYLDGYGESYHLQCRFDRMDDSVILVEKSTLHRLLDGEYLDDMRDAKEYSITEYNLETLEKKKYKVILDETTKLDAHDYDHLKRYMDAETLDRCYENNSDGCSV